MSVGHPRDQQTLPQTLGYTCDEAERGVLLEHWIFCRGHPVHEEVVVHEGHRANTYRFRPFGQIAMPGPMFVFGPAHSKRET